mgnify:CR=1 FL=1
MIDILRARAVDAHHRTALTFVRDGHEPSTVWTYGELLSRASACAQRLDELNVPRGARVLLVHPPGPAFLAAFLGCIIGGRLAVPLPHPRQKRSMGRIRAVAKDCAPSLMWTDEQHTQTVQALCDDEVDLSGLVVASSETPAPDAANLTRLLTTIPEDTQAFLQYTSGSTGSPKGVVITHICLAHQLRSLSDRGQHDSGYSLVTWLPHYHDMGLVGGLMRTWLDSGSVIQLAPAHFMQSPTSWLVAASTHKAQDIVGPDFAYELCARTPHPPLDLSHLRVLWNGAEPIRASTFASFNDVFAPMGFHPRGWLPCYGMAECTLMTTGLPRGESVSTLRLDPAALAQDRAQDSTNSTACAIVGSGRTMPGMRVAIVAPDTRSVLSDDAIGEIWVQGGSVAEGYWNKPGLNAEIFGARTSSGDGPFLRTGDLGFLRQGQVFVTGRLKDLIKVRGRNLYPQDLEAAVVAALPGTAANGVAAFALDDGSAESIALVVEGDRSLSRLGQRAAKADATAVEELAARTRAVRRAVTEECDISPRLIAFVGPGGFPRTTSGKVQRRLARERLLDGTLDTVHIDGLDEYRARLAASERAIEGGANGIVANERTHQGSAPDRSALLKVLHDAALEILAPRDRSLQKLPLDESLAGYGLDSLATAELGLLLGDRLGRPLPPELLQQCATLQALAEVLQPNAAPNGDVDKLARYRVANGRMEALRNADRYLFHPVISAYEGSYVVVRGRRLLMLGSYEYLGLLRHRRLDEALVSAAQRFGTGHHGVRILAGTTELHCALELRLSETMRAEDAIVYSSGFVTNHATIGALVGPGDRVIGDEWNHASIQDGCKASGAAFESWAHGDIGALERLLSREPKLHTLVVVDAVFSMDGDIADVRAIAHLCRRFGALLMVDEAHSLGVLGERGLGVQEHFDLPSDAIDVKMGTLSKTLAGTGGFVAGRRELIEYLRHHARGYLFSGSLPAANVAASIAALDVLRDEPQRVRALRENAAWWKRALIQAGFETLQSCTPIVPVVLADERQTLEFAHRCREGGVFAVPVLYPAVPVNAPRLRTCVSAVHTRAELEFALDVLVRVGRELGVLR